MIWRMDVLQDFQYQLTPKLHLFKAIKTFREKALKMVSFINDILTLRTVHLHFVLLLGYLFWLLVIFT